jgi:subtilase family serine protease
LRGHVNPRIANGTDLGRMDPSQVLDRVSIVFKQTPAQEADLEQLLANQQNSASPDYHKWLTPEQYADRFGASQADVDQLTSWLKQQNLTVIEVARGRNWVAFSGTVGDVEAAFATEIHRYQVDSRMHFANTTDPQIPAALEPLVGEIHGLHDFKLRAPKLKLAQYDSGRGGNTHYIAPDDIAAIYDVKPLLDSGVDGTGQKIVIIGQSNIDVSNIQQYRTYFNLPANTPQLSWCRDRKTRDRFRAMSTNRTSILKSPEPSPATPASSLSIRATWKLRPSMPSTRILPRC